MTGRTIEYVFPPAPAAPDCTGEPLLRGRRASPGRASSRTSRFTVRAGRDRRPRRAGRLRPLGDPRDHLRRPPADAGTGRGRRQARCARARCPRPSRPASAWPPRSARARRCCSTSRSSRNITLATLAPLRRGRLRSTAAPGGARGRRADHRALDLRPARSAARRAHPVRRQPAEGRAGPLAARRLPRAAARRAHPRRRRRRPQRDLRADPAAGRRGRRRVLVSSEVPEVLGLADRVLVVREGRVVHDGPAEELDEDRRARPRHGRERSMSDDDSDQSRRAGPPPVGPRTTSGSRGRPALAEGRSAAPSAATSAWSLALRHPVVVGVITGGERFAEHRQRARRSCASARSSAWSASA